MTPPAKCPISPPSAVAVATTHTDVEANAVRGPVRAPHGLFRPGVLDPAVPPAVWNAALVSHVDDFLARPGKQFRAQFAALVYADCGGPAPAVAAAVGSVIESIHAGSLIVDDVQDQSLERRGAPALHTQIGEALAINTGTWLYFAALRELFALPIVASYKAHLAERALATLMNCCQGQALDLTVQVGSVTAAQLPGLVAATTRGKTAALFGLAGYAAAAAAGAPLARAEAWAAFGEAMGIGLQMLDDLGSVCAPSRAAKGNEDLLGRRPTWVWAWVVAHCDEVTAARLLHAVQSCSAADVDRLRTQVAQAIGGFGRQQVTDHLHAALTGLAQHAQPASVARIRAELQRLEASYG